MKSIDQELQEFKEFRKRSWAKVIKRLRKQLDEYVEEQLFRGGHGDMKIGYLPLLMNIDPEGVTNAEVSKRADITKQAMSKIVNDLVALKYIVTEEHSNDGRSHILRLTEKGKNFIIRGKHCISDLMNEYRAVVGKKNFDNAMETLLKIMEYNEQRKTSDQTSKYK
jgi:DNA-binding MarR family transcriptional regulator